MSSTELSSGVHGWKDADKVKQKEISMHACSCPPTITIEMPSV